MNFVHLHKPKGIYSRKLAQGAMAYEKGARAVEQPGLMPSALPSIRGKEAPAAISAAPWACRPVLSSAEYRSFGWRLKTVWAVNKSPRPAPTLLALAGNHKRTKSNPAPLMPFPLHKKLSPLPSATRRQLEPCDLVQPKKLAELHCSNVERILANQETMVKEMELTAKQAQAAVESCAESIALPLQQWLHHLGHVRDKVQSALLGCIDRIDEGAVEYRTKVSQQLRKDRQGISFRTNVSIRASERCKSATQET